MELLILIIGLLIGYYARSIYNYVRNTYEILADKYAKSQAGVVTPHVSKVTKNSPIDLQSTTGGVMRPSPNQVALDAMKAREEKLRNDM